MHYLTTFKGGLRIAICLAILSSIFGIQKAFTKETMETNVHNENFSFESIDGGKIHLSDFKGQVILISNTASFCGFTNQYNALQGIYEEYKTKGFTVIAVPSSDFRQEYDKNDDVKDFCETNFGITFPISEITKITGTTAHPFYAWLKSEMDYAPRWNFNKILISPTGNVQKFFGSMSSPDSEKVRNSIEEILP